MNVPVLIQRVDNVANRMALHADAPVRVRCALGIRGCETSIAFEPAAIVKRQTDESSFAEVGRIGAAQV
jgi:hypothetical protein